MNMNIREVIQVDKLKGYIKDHQVVSYTVGLCAAILFYVVITHLHIILKGIKLFLGFFSPVFLGLIIAYVLDPIVRFFEKKLNNIFKSSNTCRNLATTMTYILVLILLVLIGIIIVPQVMSSVIGFAGNFDAYLSGLEQFMEDMNITKFISAADLANMFETVKTTSKDIISFVTQNIDEILSASYGVGVGMVNFFISFILSIYMLGDKERQLNGLKKLLRNLLRDDQYFKTINFARRCDRILIRFIGCDLLDGVIIGLVNAIFMMIARIPYIPLISVVVGVTNLAPTFGPFAGGLIGGFILLLVNPWYALSFILFTFCLQQIDGYVIKPKLFGDALSLPSMWVLISIVVGSKMLGVVGIVLGIPVAAIIDFVYKDYITPRLEKKKQEKEEKYAKRLTEKES